MLGLEGKPSTFAFSEKRSSACKSCNSSQVEAFKILNIIDSSENPSLRTSRPTMAGAWPGSAVEAEPDAVKINVRRAQLRMSYCVASFVLIPTQLVSTIAS
jgi:hypothetical protein